jgi:hypothetical protein
VNAVRKPLPRRKGQRFEASTTSRGGRITLENLTFIPAHTQLRLLRDQIIVAPLDVVHSRYLLVRSDSSTLIRGKIVGAGPGHYPNYYLDKHGRKNPPRHERAQVCAGMTFVPNPVRVGDVVHLDGRNTGKSAFDAFYWGDQYCIHARAEDVAGIEEEVEKSEAREQVGYMPDGEPAFMVYEKPT